MSITFKPNGSLDVSTSPTDLPDDGLARCKNLRLDQAGKVSTRDGSSKFNDVALDQLSINHIVAQGGVRYAFAGTKIFEDETSIKTGLTDAEWASVLYNAFNDTTQQIFCLNGTDRKRIEGSSVYEWGSVAPSLAPTMAIGVGSALTGVYRAKTTYCRKVGTTVVYESDPSPAPASSVTLSSQSLKVNWEASEDSQITHVRVYRTAAGGSTYYHDTDVAIGTQVLDTSTTDANLSLTEIATNHDRPPLGSFVAGPSYNGYLFIIKDNLLYYCLPKQPEYWPLTYYLEVSPPQYPGQCAHFWNGQLYYLTKHKIYMIQGTGHNSFFPLPMPSITGSVNRQAACVVPGKGIVHAGNDGVYVFDSEGDTKISGRAAEAIFRGETVNGVPGMTSMENSWTIFYKNRVYIGYTSSGYTYPTNCFCLDLDTQKLSYLSWNDNEIRTVAVDVKNNYLLAGDVSGFVWRLEDQSVTEDDSTAIAWELESKEFTLQTRAHFPRWVKYDIDASDDDCTATGKLMMDGVLHQSHTLTGNRSTKRRLVATGNGERLSHQISGSGPVKIYMVESE